MTSKRKWQLAASGLAIVVGVVAFPRAAKAYEQWKGELRKARIAQAFAALHNGAEDLPSLQIKKDLEDESAEEKPGPKTPKQDDPLMRHLVELIAWGDRTPEYNSYFARVVREETQRWGHLMPGPRRSAARGNSPLAPAAVPTWVNLGPSATNLEFNSVPILQSTPPLSATNNPPSANDTGRPTSIKVAPDEATNTPVTGNTVYVAVSGGIWKSSNFLATDPANPPVWTSITDKLGNIAIGAMDLDTSTATATAPATVYVGTGDFNAASGGMIAATSDDGATWKYLSTQTGAFCSTAPCPLLAATHPADGRANPTATNIRDLRIDPGNHANMLVTTDVGLFLGFNDCGIAAPCWSFQLINTPSSTGVAANLESAMWNLAYLGPGDGGSDWMVSGIYACATGSAPPAAGFEVFTGQKVPGTATVCTAGNLGDVWLSTNNGGTSWTSMRQGGTLPLPAGTTGDDYGRIYIASGAPQGPATGTVVYAQAGNASGGTTNLALLAGTSAGFTVKATNTTAPVNPTVDQFGRSAGTECATLDLAHEQAWYNLLVVVDPNDSNKALAGGNLCAARTLDGGATWQNIAHWLPSAGIGNVNQLGTTTQAPLPYVHADWHAGIAVALSATETLTIVGTDGGIFYSLGTTAAPTGYTAAFAAVFSSANNFAAEPTNINWPQPDTGLSDLLSYSLGTGDVVKGNHAFVITGTQDNGSRYRELSPGATSFNTAFDEIIGGDGFGNAFSSDQNGQNSIMWASVDSSLGPRNWCRPFQNLSQAIPFLAPGDSPVVLAQPLLSAQTGSPLVNGIDCNQPTFFDSNFTQYSTWTGIDLPIDQFGVDSDPFVLRFASLNDAQSTILTARNDNIFKLSVNAQGVPTILQLTNLDPAGHAGGTGPVYRGLSIVASPNTYQLPYGPPVNDLPSNVPTRLYAGPASGGVFEIFIDPNESASSFPIPGPGTNLFFGSPLAGVFTAPLPVTSTTSITFPHNLVNAGRWTMIASSASPTLSTFPLGRLFKTTDFDPNVAPGANTWTSLHGAVPGQQLPFVPVNIVQYDPSDPTDNTIYAGTDVGLYATFDGGVTWERFGQGLPAVRISDMSISSNGSLMRISTYGRGIWEIYPHSAVASAGTGDWDGNGQIDFIDLMALASRMGGTPGATLAAPNNNVYPYDSSVDIDGDGAITDADLTTLLTKFGGTP